MPFYHFSPIPRPERFLVAIPLWSARSARRADALEFIPVGRLNFAPRFPAEWTKPGIPHLLDGLDGFARHVLYRSDATTAAFGFRFSLQKRLELCQCRGFRLPLAGQQIQKCRLRHANAGSDLLLRFVTSGKVFAELSQRFIRIVFTH